MELPDNSHYCAFYVAVCLLKYCVSIKPASLLINAHKVNKNNRFSYKHPQRILQRSVCIPLASETTATEYTSPHGGT